MPKPGGKKKKRFIDPRRDATYTFSLVHRSQRDPLAADDQAPQRVLLPQNPQDEARRLKIQKQKEAQREFGVFFDDDYDYLQHMKDSSVVEHDWSGADRFFIQRAQAAEATPPPPPPPHYRSIKSVQLPGQVFGSTTEEKVGILNQAAPHSGPLLDWDPDIVETLDDAYQHEMVFTLKDDPEALGPDQEDDLTLDDFLGGGEPLSEEEDDEDDQEERDFSSDFDSNEAQDEVGSLDGRFSFTEEETQTRFTQYSMSSSVVARNEQLSQLDEQFEKFYDAYTEDNTGGLDMDEIEGHQDDESELMRKMVQAYQAQRGQERQVPDLKAEVKDRLGVKDNGDSDDDDDDDSDEDELVQIPENPKERWDCESILSTYSNIYHRPKMISEPSRKVRPIVISSKTGMPEDALGKGLTKGALRQLDRDTREVNDETCTLASRVSALSIRPKHETLEEKKNRKKAFQEFKRERRMEKKANTQAFKAEKALQERNAINNRKNIQGSKIL